MEQWQKDAFDKLEASGYLNVLRKTAMSFCVPFYWSATIAGELKILHSGTITYLDTGEKKIGITADHVYQQFLDDMQTYPDVECQFGGSTIYPQTRLIDRNAELDVATFDVPLVFVSAGHRSIHRPLKWPPDRIRKGELALYGGYPGVLRELRRGEADFAFQTFTWVMTDVSDQNMAMYVDFENLHWPGHSKERINESLGGLSGGPVFRLIEEPVSRLELVGFVHEYLASLETVRARHADCVLPSGRLGSEQRYP